MKKTIITLALISITVMGMAQTKLPLNKLSHNTGRDTTYHYQKFIKLEPQDLNQLIMIANDYRRLSTYDPSQVGDAKIALQVNLDKWLKEFQSKVKVDSTLIKGGSK